MIRRQIELLKLLSKQETFKPASFFSKELSVSTKTIYADITELSANMRTHGIDIIKSPRNGILMQGSTEQKKAMLDELSEPNTLDEYSLESRRTLLIKQVLIYSENPTLEHLSQRYMVSKTSVYNDIKVIEELLGNDEIKVLTTNSGIQIVGDERMIQKAIKKFITANTAERNQRDYLRFMEQLFDKDIIEKTQKLLFEDYAELSEQVSDYYVKSLQNTMIILIQRLRNGIHIENEDNFLFNNIRYMETYIVANSIVEEIKQCLNISFQTNDIEYLSKQLFAHRMTNSMKVSNQDYAATVKLLIDRMSEIEKMDLSHDERLFHSLLYHLPAMILRLQKGIQIRNPLLNNIKIQYSELFSITWYALSVIETQYEVTLNDDEVSLILIHFQIALDHVSKANNIIVICPYGTSSSQLILSRVKQFLPSKDHIEVSTVQKLNKNSLDNIDLIITSIDLAVENTPIIKVSPLVDNDDISNIMQAYSLYILNKNKTKKWSEKLDSFHAPCLSTFINEDLIKLNLEFNSKEECLDFLITELEQKKLVDSKFRESIFNRERMGVTSLGSGVALPHADPQTVKQSSVSIATLKKPIRWGDVNISLIIMVSFSQQDSDKFRDVINELYQIIEKREYVDEITLIDKTNDMMQLIKK